MDRMIFEAVHSIAGRNAVIDFLVSITAAYLLPLTIAAVLIFLVLKFNPGKSRRAVKKAVMLLASATIVYIALELLIQLFYTRSRPFVDYAFSPLIQHAANAGFPSTHAAISIILAYSVMRFDNKIFWAVITAAVIVSLARMIAGLHYLSDVLTGALLGLFVAWTIDTLLMTILHILPDASKNRPVKIVKRKSGEKK